MKLDKFIEQHSWKKMMFITIVIFLSLQLFSEIFFLSMFKKPYTAVTHMIESEDRNMQITKNKLDENDQKITQEFNKTFSDTSDIMQKALKELNYFNKQER